MWLLGDSGADAQGSERCSPEGCVPMPQFPQLQERRGRGSRPGRCGCSPALGTPPSAPSLGLPVLSSLQAPAHRAGPAHVGQGRGKTSGSWNFFMVFCSYPRNHHTSFPICVPKDHPPAVSLIMHLLGFMMQYPQAARKCSIFPHYHPISLPGYLVQLFNTSHIIRIWISINFP